MTTQTNWQKFDKAFENVGAYLILDKDTRQIIAKIALKYPKDGAGRLHSFMHIIGHTMETSYAGGFNYDKRSQAIINVAQKILDKVSSQSAKYDYNQKMFLDWLCSETAKSGWQEAINEKNGFIVIQVI